MRLHDFIQHYDRALAQIQHIKVNADFDTYHISLPLTTKLTTIEKHAIMVFNRQSFFKFWEELQNAKSFFVVGTAKHGVYHTHII